MTSFRAALCSVAGVALAASLPLIASGSSSPRIELGRSVSDPAPARGPSSVWTPAGPAAGAAGDRSWPVGLVNPIGSPVFCDVDGDGLDEVAVGGETRALLLDTQGNPKPGWPQPMGETNHAPAIGDIDGDATMEIVFTVCGIPPQIWAFEVDGSLQPGFPIDLPFHNWLNVSGPALADLDGDGDLDVGAAAELGIYFFDGSGRPLEGWPYLWIAPQQNIQWSCPSIADIDGDGLLEIACANNSLYYESVHVVDCFAQPEPGWPTYDIEPVFASTALADLDGDGDYEVIAKDGENTWIGHRLYVWHHDGTPMAGFPMSICEDWVSSRSNPSVGDVQGDGVLEIVTATCDGNVHVIRPDAHELPGWPKALTPNGSISTPALADVDADGQQEIFLCYWQDYSQYVGGWNLDGTVVPGFPKLLLAGTEWDAHGSPHVADFDHDGRFEVAACGTNWTSGNVCVFPIEGSVYTPGVTVCEWPKIRRDLAATGTYPALDPAGIGDPAVFAAGSFAVWPNPAGPSVVELRYAARGLASPAAGLLRAFDPLGRAVGAVQVGAAGTIAIRDLFGGDGSPASGIYWLRWEPRSGAPRSTRWIRLAD